MKEDQALTVFENFNITRVYDETEEKWYFSVVDVVAALIQQPEYQLVTNCHQLILKAADGKKYATDVADAETLLRIIQSVPSPKAEPIKLWLAKVGYERLQEMNDPALSVDRARDYWLQHGRSEKVVYLHRETVNFQRQLINACSKIGWC